MTITLTQHGYFIINIQDKGSIYDKMQIPKSKYTFRPTMTLAKPEDIVFQQEIEKMLLLES